MNLPDANAAELTCEPIFSKIPSIGEAAKAIEAILRATPDSAENDGLSTEVVLSEKVNENQVATREALLIRILRAHINVLFPRGTRQKSDYEFNDLARERPIEVALRKRFPTGQAWIEGWTVLERYKIDFEQRYPNKYDWFDAERNRVKLEKQYGPMVKYPLVLTKLADVYKYIAMSGRDRLPWPNNRRFNPWGVENIRHFSKTKYLIIGLYLHGIDNADIRAALHDELSKGRVDE